MAVTQGPDLVLLDMQLPVMDGFEVLKAIKNNTDSEQPKDNCGYFPCNGWR